MTDDLDAVALAQAFHEAYERLAPTFGYQTRKESAVPYAQVPENNRRLMEAVCREVMLPIVRVQRQQTFEEAAEAADSLAQIAARDWCLMQAYKLRQQVREGR